MKLFTLLAGAAFFASLVAANAAEPTRLSTTQLDNVTAGASGSLALAGSRARGDQSARTFSATATRAQNDANAHRTSGVAITAGSARGDDSASRSGAASLSIAN